MRRYSKCTTPSPGSEAQEDPKTATGINEDQSAEASKCTTLSPGSVETPVSGMETNFSSALAAAKSCVSLCEPWKEAIEAGLAQQLTSTLDLK